MLCQCCPSDLVKISSGLALSLYAFDAKSQLSGLTLSLGKRMATMASCASCGKSGFGFLEVKNGMCPSCRKHAEAAENAKSPEEKRADGKRLNAAREAAKNIVITTEMSVGEVERLGVVATEVVFGMNIFKDILANVRDVFGGRSGVVQKTLEDARTVAFDELRIKASNLGADAIIAVDIDYHSVSTGSAVNMMMVAISGTAVQMK